MVSEAGARDMGGATGVVRPGGELSGAPVSGGRRRAGATAGAADGTAGAAETLLGVLRTVEADDAVTQRSLAAGLGIALGLANIYLKRCIKKGLIKVRQVPTRRYVYYLTPEGFAEKTRLTAEYLSASFGFFRKTRGQMADLYLDCQRAGHDRLVLAGAGDLAEVAALAAMESDVTVLAILDPAATTNRIAGIPVVRSLDAVGGFDAVVITEIRAPQRIYDGLAATLADGRIHAPAVLGIVRGRICAGPDAAR